jgi:hypothetical protein
MGVLHDSISYDLLMKGETMTWIFRYRLKSHSFVVGLIAGKVTIELFEGDELLATQELAFDQSNANNSHEIKGETRSMDKYIKIRVTALENADYSLEVIKENIDDSPSSS